MIIQPLLATATISTSLFTGTSKQIKKKTIITGPEMKK